MITLHRDILRITGSFLGKVTQEQFIVYSRMSLLLQETSCREKWTPKETELQVVLLSHFQMGNRRLIHHMMLWDIKFEWMSYRGSSKQMSSQKQINPLFSQGSKNCEISISIQGAVFPNWAGFNHSAAVSLIVFSFLITGKWLMAGEWFLLCKFSQPYYLAKKSLFTYRKAQSTLKVTMPSLEGKI